MPYERRNHSHVKRDVDDIRTHGPPCGLSRHGQSVRHDLHGTRKAGLAALVGLLDQAVGFLRLVAPFSLRLYSPIAKPL